jgi:hypothetical protein
MTSRRIKYRVVFVDDSTSHGRSWKDYALTTLQERHASLAPDMKRSGIWVFDAKLLGFDELEMTEGSEVERLAVMRFD